MSVRATILANLLAELATITTANGYATNVGEVLADVKHSQATNIGPGKVSVQIADEGDGEVIHNGAGGLTLIPMTIEIRGAIEGAVGEGVPYQTADSWLADLRKLIRKPIVLGANFRFARVLATPTINLFGSDAIVRVPVEIVYWFDQDAP